jgi:hypothetical protein
MDGWISVKVRLPEEDDTACLVYDIGSNRTPVVAWYEFDGVPAGFYTKETHFRIIVTHWMPLPKAPSE